MNESYPNRGYIYIFKCIVGSGSCVCKIGKTKHFHDKNDRLEQHGRTLYYGFVPYTEFLSGSPIATGFEVKDYNKADRLVRKQFKDRQFAGIEIYNVDYDEAVEELYNFLKNNDQFINLIEDNYSQYSFLNKAKISKKQFEDIKSEILKKYKNKLPDELLDMLREKKEYEENCRSHYVTGNYIDFPGNKVLDIHYNKSKRSELLNKLKDILK